MPFHSVHAHRYLRALSLSLLLFVSGMGCTPATPSTSRPTVSSESAPTATTSNSQGQLVCVYAPHIYVMNADGSNETRIVMGISAAWSPDGSRIAFAANSDDGSGKLSYGIYVMNSDGSNVTRLTTSSEREYAPDWSSDGSRIAFNSERDGNISIYVMNADGSNLTLIGGRQECTNPKWRPMP